MTEREYSEDVVVLGVVSETTKGQLVTGSDIGGGHNQPLFGGIED